MSIALELILLVVGVFMLAVFPFLSWIYAEFKLNRQWRIICGCICIFFLIFQTAGVIVAFDWFPYQLRTCMREIKYRLENDEQEIVLLSINHYLDDNKEFPRLLFRSSRNERTKLIKLYNELRAPIPVQALSPPENADRNVKSGREMSGE